MSMHYREKQTISKEFVEVEIYPVWSIRPGQRRAKSKPTNEMQEVLNAKNSSKKLGRLLNCNFGRDDLEVHLTYEKQPENEDRAKRDFNNYMRRIKRIRERAGLAEVKYIVVMESSSSGMIHFHVTMSGGINRDLLESVWGKGRANSRRLQPDDEGLAALSGYMYKPVKEERRKKGSRRWWGSRNLDKPVETVADWKHTKREVANMTKMSNVELANKYPGNRIINSEVFYNDVNGGVYISILMRRDESEKRHEGTTKNKIRSKKKKAAGENKRK